jgi:Cyclin, N-terminal domain
MVDWMIEVFGNYKTTTTNFTLFRAVNLMDLFMRSTQRVYGESDLHLIGIGAMFIASKIEDVYHIPMNDMVRRVAHNKFSIGQIKQMENDLMNAIQFNVYFPTHLNYLSYFFFRSFLLSDK